MSKITVAGAGAFGSALAVALDMADHDVTLVGRSVDAFRESRDNPRLAGVPIPQRIKLSTSLEVTGDDLLLLAVPMQSLAEYLSETAPRPKAAIACCKGVDLATGRGPSAIMRDALDCPSAILTGPSFAADIARGLPTALVVATQDPMGPELQETLSTDTLRLYLSDDPIGAELGGALKNVIAIACGLCIGAGIGESARAALMTRGMAEILRVSVALGAKPETLAGLAGFGDLALTCTSEQSRNFSLGLSIGGKGEAPKATTEGRHTARAIVKLAEAKGVEMPIAKMVAGVVEGKLTLEEALSLLLSRPLTKEWPYAYRPDLHR
ncbi:glycerol-3-phosphate dehydrogenase (NAD(P)+) [Litoreibacter ponti]|uniref:Glycerol-3-phosphate dehydrogenase [NAD(P)+] n=1 Tax=Litoreibacter ponti TaxID=1510457 RepID=A0A2T6BPU6_9RHOB|nr:NAD(P)H-dependent glycerol-3-phosphate dehydrogenase [Litoreibacter ponti]PTX58120.1 glycerol-3-phosphate dehydrogenase (NAD(P)+) [Litoreibacter ponti]